jgi:SAM-dependent methyltransferase
MNDKFYDSVLSLGFDSHRIKLWEYQYLLGRDFTIEYLKWNNAFASGSVICEIGSGEGGVAQALALAGAKEVLCTDILEHRLEAGQLMANNFGLNIKYIYHNVMEDDIPAEWLGKFDLVIFRDVMEHLEDPELAMKRILLLLKQDGKLFITFPPYYSPYGGHQQIVRGNIFSKLPFIHYLPKNIFKLLVSSGLDYGIDEVIRLKDYRLTPRKLKKIAKKLNYSITTEDYFLLRPVFKPRFNLPVFKISFLKKIPGLIDILSLEASFVLSKSGK